MKRRLIEGLLLFAFVSQSVQAVGSWVGPGMIAEDEKFWELPSVTGISYTPAEKHVVSDYAKSQELSALESQTIILKIQKTASTHRYVKINLAPFFQKGMSRNDVVQCTVKSGSNYLMFGVSGKSSDSIKLYMAKNSKTQWNEVNSTINGNSFSESMIYGVSNSTALSFQVMTENKLGFQSHPTMEKARFIYISPNMLTSPQSLKKIEDSINFSTTKCFVWKKR